MKNKRMLFIAIAGLMFLLLFGNSIGTYNKLQVMDESVTSSWAQIENQLKRRNDLIPLLANTVKGYAKHEKEIFTNVAESRAKLAGAVKSDNVNDIKKANAEFTGALSRLLVVAEQYPQLKADRNFMMMQDELAGTENRLAVSRKDYNESVKALNTTIRTFPTSLIAGFSGIKSREYFEIEEPESNVPKINF